MQFVRVNIKRTLEVLELISDEDSATLMPEADEEKLDEVIDHAIDVVLGV